MIDGILSFAIRQRWLVMIGVLAMAWLRRLEFRPPADRRRSRHHQRPGSDQQPRAGLFAAGSRAAHHLSDRDGDGRLACLESTRSLSRYGLSQVTVIFKDGTDIYFARQIGQ